MGHYLTLTKRKMNKTITIAKRTLLDNFNRKSLLFLLFILITSVLFLQSGIVSKYNVNLNDFRVLEALYTSKFLMIGFIWTLGIPVLIYFALLISGSISKEINSGMTLLVLTRPVKREEYLLGKFLGYWKFFNLFNLISLILIPAANNVFFGMPAAYLIPMYKVALALFVYGIILTAILTSLGIMLSCKIKRSLISLMVLFVFLLTIYLVPLVNNVSSGIPYLIKPFFSIIDWFNIGILPDAARGLSMFTGTYYVSSNLVFSNFGSPLLTILLFVGILIGLLVLARFIFIKKDIF
jgi:ABC-type transport system involved in multi-copper enzyme maturation permease subunit